MINHFSLNRKLYFNWSSTVELCKFMVLDRRDRSFSRRDEPNKLVSFVRLTVSRRLVDAGSAARKPPIVIRTIRTTCSRRITSNSSQERLLLGGQTDPLLFPSSFIKQDTLRGKLFFGERKGLTKYMDPDVSRMANKAPSDLHRDQ